MEADLNLGEIKTHFSGLLNRRDITTAQRDIMITSGIQRAQRELRVPAMEKLIDAGVSDGVLLIPDDLIELKDLINSDGKRIGKKDLSLVKQLAKHNGVPVYYHREGGWWLLGPAPETGQKVRIIYYAEFPPLVLDTDTNVITVMAPDLFYYAALTYVGDFVNDKRVPAWEVRYQQILGNLNDQAMMDETSGASTVTSTYFIPHDDE